MAIRAPYLLTSREVLKVFRHDDPLDLDPIYWGVLVEPALPDGADVKERLADGTFGPARVLGFAKIADLATNTVRNATQAELETFAAAYAAYENAQDAERARSLFDHPQFGRVLTAALEEAEAAKPAGQRRSADEIKASAKARVR